MNTETEEKSTLSSIQSPVQTVHNTKKLPRFTYDSDFLLSLRELHVCNRLPKGVDESILGEFHNASSAASEQQKTLVGTFFQNAKLNEHGYVQSNRVESSTNYSRGAQGRWETRFSGSNDREDLQVDRESELGRRYVNPSRQSWQQTEHDGLLGKPSGYSRQASAQRVQGNSSYQLNKSTEPYQPPRLYKQPAPYVRSNTDSFNDETFGSSECSSLDRAEEEKRRASFESMRREQQKTLQGKQKYIPDDQKNLLGETATSLNSLDSAQAVGNIIKSSKLEENVFHQTLQHGDSSGSSLQLQAPAARPLVPPGFGNNTVEKKLLPPSSNGSHSVEVEKSVTSTERSIKHSNGIENIFGKDVNGNVNLASRGFETSDIPSDSLSYDIHRIPEASEGWKDDSINDSNHQKVSDIKLTNVVDEDHPTSILDKLFQNALTRPDGGIIDFIEHRDLKGDETRTPSLSSSSKFAHFFLEDQRKSVAENLLSLGGSNDEVGHVASIGDVENITKIVPSVLHIKNEENFQDLFSTEKSTKAIKQDLIFHSSKTAESSDLLTCEYIEQLMLAEANAGSSNMQQSMPESPSLLNLRSKPQKNCVDDHASQHLLSLLQRGTHLSDSTPFFNENAISSENVDSSNLKPSYVEGGIHDTVAETSGVVQGTNSSLTLEALFGSAFMKELQSAEAPVSEHRASVGGTFKTIFQHSQESEHPQIASSSSDLFSITEEHSSLIENEGSLPYNVLEAQSSKSQIFWTGSETLETKRSKSSFMEGTADIRLPEEENLITLGDSMGPINPGFYPFQSKAKHEELLLSNTRNNIVDRLVALNPALGNGKTCFSPGLDGPHSVRGSYDQSTMDDSYQQLYGRPSSLPHHQISHSRPPFQQWDPHASINSQMNTIDPENLHDRRHPYSSAMTQHDSLNNPGRSHLGPASHFEMVHRMPILGDFPPQQVPAHQRGPPHPFSHAPRYTHEMNQNNPMHGFPLNHQQQPAFGGPGVGMPGMGVGSGVNHPDALGRLIEMELRAKSKQNHLVAGGHVSSIYPDVDVGFRYR